MPVAQLPADLQTIFPRQHDIQDDDIIPGDHAGLLPLKTIVGSIHRIAVILQDRPQGIAQATIIFHQQYAHFRSPMG